ncbi:MAG: PaaI family thioesterase [Panacagrimonas sp.]
MAYQGQIVFELIEEAETHVIGEMPVTDGIRNPFGTAHAGAILWFADVCATHLAFGGQQMKPGGAGFPLAISLNANLLGNQTDGVFRARSEFVKRGRRLSVVRTTVTGDNDRKIAEVTTSHIPA